MSILGRFGGRGRRGVSVKLVENRFPEARRDIHRAMMDTLERIADEIVEDASQRAPIATGELAESIRSQKR